MKQVTLFCALLYSTFLYGWDDSNETLKQLFNSQMKTTIELSKLMSPGFYEAIQPSLIEIREAYANSNRPTVTLLYFFSTKGSLLQLNSFYSDVAKLKKQYPNINAFGVLNGFPEDSGAFEKLLTNASKLSASKYIKIKFLPYLYKRLNIKEVPVYAYAVCPNSEYSLSKCDIQYVARGNVGVGGLLELMSEKDKKYEEVFNALYDVN